MKKIKIKIKIKLKKLVNININVCQYDAMHATRDFILTIVFKG